MLESFLAKYGYIAILLGTAFEGETIMIMGGFSAHRGYLELLPWVVLAGFVGNFIQNMIYFVLGRRRQFITADFADHNFAIKDIVFLCDRSQPIGPEDHFQARLICFLNLLGAL